MYIFIPNEQEIRTKQFNVRYSCAKDIYERFLMGPTGTGIVETTENWKSRLHTSVNVFRMEEHDWKMVYLARTAGSDTGTVSWKFDFSPQGMRVRDIQIKVGKETFYDGKVDIHYLKDGGSPLASSRSLMGLSKFTIQAKFSGGQWHQSQIFRQGMGDKKDYPFEVNVQFL